jgi:hypothetical protein
MKILCCVDFVTKTETVARMASFTCFVEKKEFAFATNIIKTKTTTAEMDVKRSTNFGKT